MGLSRSARDCSLLHSLFISRPGAPFCASGDSYATPAAFELDGKPVLAVFNGGGYRTISRKDGKLLHTMEWKTTYDINAASPIVIDDSVFISSGLAHGCALLNIGKKLEVQWEAKSMTNKMSGCVRIGDCLYGVSERGLMCISLDDGSMKWLDRSTKDGALTAAGDRLIVLTEKGELVIGKASPDGFEPTARKQVLEGGVCWTTPVISKGRIYCRNSLGELVCRDNN